MKRKMFVSRSVLLAVAAVVLFTVGVAGAAIYGTAPATPYGGTNAGSRVLPKVLVDLFDHRSDAFSTFDSPFFNGFASGKYGSASWDEVGTTTTHEEMMAFLDALPRDFMRMQVIGEFASLSNDGTVVDKTFRQPLLVFSNPPVFDPGALKVLGKPVVYLQGQIHGDETTGNEALLALAKQLALGKVTDANGVNVLERISVVMLPRLNVDGAWRYFRGTNVTAPVYYGTASGAGSDISKNGRRLDQNRDSISTISPIMRTMRNMQMLYRPDVAVDFHEMGHTLAKEFLPASGDSDAIENSFKYYYNFDMAALCAPLYDVPMPIQDLAYELKNGVIADSERQGLVTERYYYPANSDYDGYRLVRVSTDVLSTDNATVISGEVRYPNMLVEGPPDESITDSAGSLAPAATLLFESRSPRVLHNYKTRVAIHYVAAESILKQVAARSEVFRKTVADGAVALANARGPITLWSRPAEELSPDLKVRELNAAKTEVKETTLKLEKYFVNKGLKSVKTVTRPYAYIISADAANADYLAERLSFTGSTISRLTSDAVVSVEAYTVNAMTGYDANLTPTRSGDYPTNPTIRYFIDDVSTATKEITFPKGTYVVNMAQPSATLTALALEPLANRNLANYWYTLNELGEADRPGFEGYIPFAVGGEYPVYRYMDASALPTEDMITERPFVDGALTVNTKPFCRTNMPSGINNNLSAGQIAYGYNFTVANPNDPSVPPTGKFTVALPVIRDNMLLGNWFAYDWSSKAFVQVAPEMSRGGSEKFVELSGSYVSDTGEVFLVADAAYESDGSGGTCSAFGLGGLLMLALAPMAVLAKKR